MNYPQDFINKIIQGDCLEVMKDIPDNSIDLVVTDPPYFVLKQNKKLEKAEWDNFKDLDSFIDFTKSWLNECYRILKDDRQLYTFWSQMWIRDFWNMEQPFEIKRMLIWHHPNCTKGFTSKMYLWTYDPVFFLTKGKVKLRSSFLKSENVDVFKFAMPQTNFKRDKQIHFLQKPLDLLKILVNNSSDENMVVLDMFSGSGTVGKACKELKRDFILIDISPDYCKIARNRVYGLEKFVEVKKL